MHLKLPADYVHPRTQIPLPNAVLVIFDTEFAMRRGDTRVTARIYASPSVIGVPGAELEEYPITLASEERDTQLPALLLALYSVVAARPEYTGATVVP